MKKILDTSKLDKEFAKMGDLATVNVRTAVIAFFTVPETGKAIKTAVQSVVPPAVKSAFASLPNGSKVKLTDEESQTVTGVLAWLVRVSPTRFFSLIFSNPCYSAVSQEDQS